MAKKGLIGWFILISWVAWWDYFVPDSLSACFYRGACKHRPVIITVWAVTSAHLFKLLPERLDPFHYLARFHAPT